MLYTGGGGFDTIPYMKAIEYTNSLLSEREDSDMLISTELLISMLFANTRAQMSDRQMNMIQHNGEVNIVSHQLQMMLNLTENEANLLVGQYLGEV